MKDKSLEDFLPDKNASYFNDLKERVFNEIISKQEVITEIQKVMDPEIPVNIYDLGLIYKITIDEHNNVYVEMTLTNPNCPVAGIIPQNVGKAIEKNIKVCSIKVALVWDPKWNKEMMSEDAKLALDIF